MPDLVSIITPMFNSEKYIEQTARSALSQSYDRIELIIVDDCSSDRSTQIVRALDDPRVKLIEQSRNTGAGITRNLGVRAASGRYLAFLDSDDLWHPGKLERQIAFMQANAVQSCYTLYDLIDDDGNVFGDCGDIPAALTYRQLLPHNPIRTSSFVYDAAALGKIPFPAIRKRQDFGLFLEATKRAGQSVLFPETTNSYRVRPNSVSGKKLQNIPYQWAFYRECLSLGRPYSAFLIAQWFARAGRVELRRKLQRTRS